MVYLFHLLQWIVYFLYAINLLQLIETERLLVDTRLTTPFILPQLIEASTLGIPLQQLY